ncbi:DUF1366 domain-containing protein [Streptococcus pasteurianus]|nr:phage protein [Streptococcus pasteurianus]
MKLSFNSKSQEIGLDGTISGTRVVLSNNEGGFLPVMLPADKISLSNSELEELALAVVYQENFPQRAENEKFAEITKELANYKENSEVAQATLLDVVAQLCEQGILTEEFSA